MNVHWQSEDGTTEIWLNDWKGDRCRLIITIPDGPLHPCMGDSNDRFRYSIEVAERLMAMVHKIFGVSGTDKIIATEGYVEHDMQRYPPDALYLYKQWMPVGRRLEFQFIGKLSPDFDASKADWQMDTKMLEAPNA